MNTWLESCKYYIFANFIYYTFGWWLLLLCTIFFVASTSLAKCYSRRRLCSWLFSEETLWVAWEKLFLVVLDNNNNNSNNNNDNNNKNNNNDNNNNNNCFLNFTWFLFVNKRICFFIYSYSNTLHSRANYSRRLYQSLLV